MIEWKPIAFLLLACAIEVLFPFIPGVGSALGMIACDAGETFEWKQTSAGTESSWSWVCVDGEGRFEASETSVRPGEIGAFGVSLAAGAVIAAVPFAVGRAIRHRRGGGGSCPGAGWRTLR
ncbi:MAG: hypothetical protein HYY06_09775 [Deltaproteobacteria bacterium]|nr:hypothetical protein [Deltaproteobacteria bacterium]